MNFVAYPIKNFAEEKVLAVDIFLSLPKNKKYIKLRSAGDRMDLDFIEKLSGRGVAQLFVNCDPSTDHSVLKLFIEENIAVAAVDSSVVEKPVTTPTLQAFAAPESIAAEEGAVSSISPPQEERIENETISGEIEAPLPELSFSKEASSLQELSFSPDAAQEEEEFKIDGSIESKKEEELRFGKEEPKVSSETFVLRASQEAENEEDQVFRSENPSSEPQKPMELNLASNESFEESKTENQVQKLSRISANKTSMAPNLAPQIAFGLGYTNIDFLTEIALAATLHFREEEGSFPSLPPEISILRQSMQDEQESKFKDDAKDVIHFLETYLSDPDCTQLKGEIVPVCLERTLQKLLETQKLNDLWNVGLWSSTLSTTLSMESYSTCSKAAAKASKLIRDADSAI